MGVNGLINYEIGDQGGRGFAWFTSQTDALDFKRKCEQQEPEGRFYLKSVS